MNHPVGHGIDGVILWDRDANAALPSSMDGTREERLYRLQNWRGDVVKLISAASGGRQAEGARFSSYGVPWGIALRDIDGDGDVDTDDSDFMLAWSGVPASYDVRGDFDLDGDVDSNDETIFNGNSDPALGWGSLSNFASRKGYAGYEHDGNFDVLAHVRNRVYASDFGRWTRRDPAGFVDGVNLYGYVRENPLGSVDPRGLEREPPFGSMECAPGRGGCGGGFGPPSEFSLPHPDSTGGGRQPQRRCSGTRTPNPYYSPTPNGCGGSGGISFPNGPWLIDHSLFLRCCNEHDICYGSCNCKKSTCDTDFYNCMVDKCARSCTGYDFCDLHEFLCREDARMYYHAVRFFGQPFYEEGQLLACYPYVEPIGSSGPGPAMQEATLENTSEYDPALIP